MLKCCCLTWPNEGRALVKRRTLVNRQLQQKWAGSAKRAGPYGFGGAAKREGTACRAPTRSKCHSLWPKRMAALSGRGRQRYHRTLRKEIKRAQHKVMPHHGHDGPILGASDVVKAKRVPRDDVGIFDGTIRFGPHSKSVVAFAFR